MSIPYSKKFGLNPSVLVCPCCGKDYSIALFGTKWKDENGKIAQAPMQVMSNELCDDCKKVVRDGGRFFIEVRDGESGSNPYRTGRVAALKKEACERIFNVPVQNVNYMEQTTFTQLFGEFVEDNK